METPTSESTEVAEAPEVVVEDSYAKEEDTCSYDAVELERLLKYNENAEFSYADETEFIKELVIDIAEESNYWKREYKKPGSDFARKIKEYNDHQQEVKRHIETGSWDADKILSYGAKTLASELAEAYGLAQSDIAAWTRATEAIAQKGGDNYAKASVKASWMVQLAEFVRGTVSFSLGLGIYFAPQYAVPLVIARTGLNTFATGWQFYASCCSPCQSAVSGLTGISRQVQWGKSYSPNVKSDRYIDANGNTRLIPVVPEVEARLNDIALLEKTLRKGSSDREQLKTELLKRGQEFHKKIIDSLTKKATRIEAQIQAYHQRGLKPLPEEMAFLMQFKIPAKVEEEPRADLKTLRPIQAEVSELKATCKLLAKIPFGVGFLPPAGSAAFDRHFEGIEFCALQLEALAQDSNKELSEELLKRRADDELMLAIAHAYVDLHVQVEQGISRTARTGLAALATLFSSFGPTSTIYNYFEQAQKLIPAMAGTHFNATLSSSTNQTMLWTFANDTLAGNSTVIADVAQAATDVTLLVSPLSLGLDLAASITAGLALPAIYGEVHPIKAARDYQNKLMAQCTVLALTPAGNVADDKGNVDPERLDKLVRGSRATRFDQLAIVHRFDKLVYTQAALTFLIDPEIIDDLKAPVATYMPAPIDQEPGDHVPSELWVPRTFACMARIFDKCTSDKQRSALLEDWAKSVQLKFDDLASMRAILAQYEVNALAISAMQKLDLLALVSPKSPALLPPGAARILISALGYAGVPLDAPPKGTVQYNEWYHLVHSDQYRKWVQRDDDLGAKKGWAIKFSNKSAIEAAAKLGPAFAGVIAGSNVPPLVKAVCVLIADVVLVMGNLSANAIVTASFIKLVGIAFTTWGYILAISLAYAYHQFISLKNRDLQGMEARGIREVAHAGVIENKTRDFFTWINMRVYLRPEGWVATVTDFTTLSAAKISVDHLPPRPMVFSNEISLAKLTWTQMFAADLSTKLFSYCGLSAPKLSDLRLVTSSHALTTDAGKTGHSVGDVVFNMPEEVTKEFVEDAQHGLPMARQKPSTSTSESSSDDYESVTIAFDAD